MMEDVVQLITEIRRKLFLLNLKNTEKDCLNWQRGLKSRFFYFSPHKKTAKVTHKRRRFCFDCDFKPYSALKSLSSVRFAC